MNAKLDEGFDASITPRDVPGLITCISSKFHCVMGLPMAYMEIPTFSHPEAPRIRGVYTTLGYAMKSWRPDAEPQLCESMWGDFQQYWDTYVATFHGSVTIGREDGIKPLLFWRRLPNIEEMPPQDAGPSFDANGSWVEGQATPVTILRARVWIPGVTIRTLQGLSPTYV